MFYKIRYPDTAKNTLLPPLLTGSALKWIALVTMLTDHIGAVFLESGVISAYNQQLSSAWDFETTSFLYQGRPDTPVSRKNFLPHFLFSSGGRLCPYLQP